MALIVEDGTGRADAESLASVSFADTYVTSNYGSSHSWFGYDNTEKERRLRVGTRYLEIAYERELRGSRVFVTQALSWPRTDVVVDDGWDVGYDSVPDDIKRATVEAALIGDLAVMLPAVATPGVKRSMRQLGPMKTETEYVGASIGRPAYPVISQMLARYCDGGRVTRS